MGIFEVFINELNNLYVLDEKKILYEYKSLTHTWRPHQDSSAEPKFTQREEGRPRQEQQACFGVIDTKIYRPDKRFGGPQRFDRFKARGKGQPENLCTDSKFIETIKEGRQCRDIESYAGEV